MAYFAYSAIDHVGKTRKGRLEAVSRSAALDKLRADGLTLLELSETGAADGKDPFWKKKISFAGKPSRETVAATTRQLATLLKAGLPLDKALFAIYDGDPASPMTPVVASLRETIVSGQDLARGLARYPRVFSPTYVAMAKAGENSGALDLVLERLADHLEREVVLRRKARAALAYPLMMIVVGLAIVLFLLAYVIPQVTRIFADMGRELPLPTRILLALSDAVRDWWPVFLLVIATLVLVVWRFAKSSKGSRFLQARLFTTPGIGPVYARAQLGAVARALGMLLKNGAPLLKALQIAQAASPNVLVRESVGEMMEGAQAGKELSVFMTSRLLYPGVARQMVAAGEKSGKLAEMLLWVARDCENHVENRLAAFASLLEPILILVLGALVGFVVIAIILPIFEMSSLAG